MKTTICDGCGKLGARLRQVTRTYGRGRNVVLIEGVPVVACPSCGETYLTANTLHKIARIRANPRRLATVRSVHVARFGGVA